VDPNPVLKKLGFSNKDCIAIIHTDDIGMCQASVAAFAELWEYGVITSGATMVPCPWFPEAAKLCRQTPGIDMGVHSTLTSEWETYRWGPISTRDPASGIIDPEGFFFHSSDEVQEHGNANAVRMEIQAQIDKAIAGGIRVTHLDTHMGAIGSLNFIPDYLSLALQYGLPPMIMRLDKAGWIKMGFDDPVADMAVGLVNQLEEQGVPLLDRISGLELNQAKNKEDRIAYAKETIGKLEPGITHFIIHPSVDTPELRAITPDWPFRVADYEAFMSQALRDYLKNSHVQVLGYQALKDLLASGN